MPNYPLPPEEVAAIVNEFIDEQGLFEEFKTFVQNKGYSLEELGMDENI